MDSIKKKMLAMKLEKENALDKAINLESQLKEKARDFEKKEEEMNEMLAKVKNIQAEVDTVQESLQEAISKLEETEKRATNAEAEVAAMTRRIRLLEEDFEQSSGRLTETSTKLDDASKAAEESESARWRLNNQQGADELKISELERAIATATMATEEAEWKYEEVPLWCFWVMHPLVLLSNCAKTVSFGECPLLECMKKADYCSTSLSKKTIYSNFNGRACRNRKTLETRSISDDERMAQLEDQVKEAKYIAEDAERKYDEAARRLAITEVDLERAESRLETSESKIVELEEELRIVGNNMKSLEVSEQESLQREESYEETIRDLTERLKTAEQRAAEAERQVSKLQNEVDRLEDELLSEKERYRAISGELDTTFAELTSF